METRKDASFLGERRSRLLSLTRATQILLWRLVKLLNHSSIHFYRIPNSSESLRTPKYFLAKKDKSICLERGSLRLEFRKFLNDDQLLAIRSCQPPAANWWSANALIFISFSNPWINKICNQFHRLTWEIATERPSGQVPFLHRRMNHLQKVICKCWHSVLCISSEICRDLAKPCGILM